MTKPALDTEKAKLRAERLGTLYVLLSAVCFSLAGVLIKVIPWGTMSINAGRSFFAAFVIYIFMRSKGGKLVVNKQVLIAAFINFLMITTFVLANKMTTAANAIVLQFTAPIWVIGYTWFLTKKKPSGFAILTSFIVLAGIVCFFADSIGEGEMLGNIIAIISGITYAAVFVFKKIPGCDFESVALLSFVFAGVAGIPSLMGETVFTPVAIGAVVVMGVFQMGIAYVLLSKGLDAVSPVTAALTSTLEPILNPILVALILGEVIGPLSIFGAVLVIGASTAYNLFWAPDVEEIKTSSD